MKSVRKSRDTETQRHSLRHSCAGRNPDCFHNVKVYRQREFFDTNRHSLVCLVFIVFFLFLSVSGAYAQKAVRIKDKRLDEVSGIAAGRTNPGLYYVHNDSGGKAEVYVLDSKGKTVSILALEGTLNRDWEDIAVGPDSLRGSNCIYVGEIGDNNARYDGIYLYRFNEPPLTKLSAKKPQTVTVTATDTLRIVYEDGPKDSETLFIDPYNADVYLVSKREMKVGLYQVRAPLSNTDVNLAERVLTLDFPLAVGGDISLARDKVIIKTYDKVFSWEVLPEQEIADALSQPPVELPYKPEPQGEAVCWSLDGRSYLTLSEWHKGKKLYLNIYPAQVSEQD